MMARKRGTHPKAVTNGSGCGCGPGARQRWDLNQRKSVKHNSEKGGHSPKHSDKIAVVMGAALR